MSKAYKLRRADRTANPDELKAGQIVFKYGYNDYGLASEDSRNTGIEHVSCCLEPNTPDTPSFTIPFADLEPVMHYDMVKMLTKDPAVIHASFAQRLTALNIGHMGIGLGSEYFELCQATAKKDRVNVLEELGDLLFYTEGLLIGLPVDRDYVLSVQVAHGSFVDTMELALTTIKNHSFWEKELNLADLVRAYQGLIYHITTNAKAYGFTFEAVQDANVGKLGVRYRNFVFSNLAAAERADKQDELKLS